jgi:peptide deformylase
MILPIVAYGDPVLREEAEEIGDDYPNLKELIANMYETMYKAPGVGLAAPQIGLAIRLFVVDTVQMFEEDEDGEKPKKKRKKSTKEEQEVGIIKAFINPIILEEGGKLWPYEEGCLSIPGIHEEVMRHEKVTIEYQNENFELITETYDGLTARVIQHEYDHIEGVLFTDKLKPLKRQLLKKRLDRISKGDVDVSYRMNFPMAKKGR